MLVTNRKFLSYDPARDTEASFWVATAGAVAASGANLTVNADTLLSLEAFRSGVLKINAEIPAAPTGGDDRKLGFYGVNTSAYAWFFVEGTALKCQTRDESGTTATATISWSDGTIENWTNTAAIFEIRWEAGIVKFLINGRQRVQLSSGIPRGMMSVYLHNANADDLDIKGVTVDGW